MISKFKRKLANSAMAALLFVDSTPGNAICWIDTPGSADRVEIAPIPINPNADSSPTMPELGKFSPVCKCTSLGNGSVDVCVFTLDSYSYKGPDIYLHPGRELFSKIVANYISSRYDRGELHITVHGFADSIPNLGWNPSSNLGDECLEMLHRKGVLSYDDYALAESRACQIRSEIHKVLGTRRRIAIDTTATDLPSGTPGKASDRRVEVTVVSKGHC